eukprot:jgi/Antlo1/111/2294
MQIRRSATELCPRCTWQTSYMCAQMLLLRGKGAAHAAGINRTGKGGACSP